MFVKSFLFTYVKNIDNDVTHRKIFTLSKLLVIFYTQFGKVQTQTTAKAYTVSFFMFSPEDKSVPVNHLQITGPIDFP